MSASALTISKNILLLLLFIFGSLPVEFFSARFIVSYFIIKFMQLLFLDSFVLFVYLCLRFVQCRNLVFFNSVLWFVSLFTASMSNRFCIIILSFDLFF